MNTARSGDHLRLFESANESLSTKLALKQCACHRQQSTKISWKDFLNGEFRICLWEVNWRQCEIKYAYCEFINLSFLYYMLESTRSDLTVEQHARRIPGPRFVYTPASNGRVAGSRARGEGRDVACPNFAAVGLGRVRSDGLGAAGRWPGSGLPGRAPGRFSAPEPRGLERPACSMGGERLVAPASPLGGDTWRKPGGPVC